MSQALSSEKLIAGFLRLLHQNGTPKHLNTILLSMQLTKELLKTTDAYIAKLKR